MSVRLFVVLLSWFVGYVCTLASVMRTNTDDKDKEDEESGVISTIITTGLFIWPLIGCITVAYNLAKLYEKEENTKRYKKALIQIVSAGIDWNHFSRDALVKIAEESLDEKESK